MRLKFFFLSACLIVSCGLSAGTLDFVKLSPTELVLPLQAKGQSAEAGTADGRPALLLEWNCGEARWFSLNCKHSPHLPEFDRAEFSLEFFRPQGSTVRRASLLLTDRDSEVFQLTTTLPAGKNGWETVKFTLDPKVIKGNVWGGKKKNRIPDFPLRIAGVTCSYAATQGIESAALGQLTWKLSPGAPPTAPSAVALPPGRELVDFSTLLDSEINPRLGGKIVTARRAGTTASLDVLNKYFTDACMPVVSSTYWNMAHGVAPDEIERDDEGLQTMRNLGHNMAWLLKCIEAGRERGITPRTPETGGWTNFIR